jgi:DNA-binding transcriptional LysR family regulator
VFRRINGLEEKLGVRLFERSSGTYTLTKGGEEILGRVQIVEEQIYAIDRSLIGKDIRLSGNLKISTTDTIGYYWLPPFIKKFQTHYPEILIDIDIQTKYTNLTKREADIVIPAVNIQPDYMVGRKLSPIYFRLYAAKSYIDRNGMPESVQAFEHHSFLAPNEALASISASKWLRKYVPDRCIVATGDKLTTLYRLARQGIGIAPLPHYVCETDETMDEVMELPPDCHRHVWILTHPDLRSTARIKAFMQFMYHESNAER